MNKLWPRSHRHSSNRTLHLVSRLRPTQPSSLPILSLQHPGKTILSKKSYSKGHLKSEVTYQRHQWNREINVPLDILSWSYRKDWRQNGSWQRILCSLITSKARSHPSEMNNFGMTNKRNGSKPGWKVQRLNAEKERNEVRWVCWSYLWIWWIYSRGKRAIALRSLAFICSLRCIDSEAQKFCCIHLLSFSPRPEASNAQAKAMHKKLIELGRWIENERGSREKVGGDPYAGILHPWSTLLLLPWIDSS